MFLIWCPGASSRTALLGEDMKMGRFFVRAVGPCTVVALLAGQALGQSSDAAAAESLFRAGRALMEQKNYAQACPKLAESFRLDPGTGALLALAFCHEGEGKLASAWSDFAEVATRSKQEGRADRADLARGKMKELEPRLPMLTIAIAPGGEKIRDLEIKRDGTVVGSGSLATAVAVDPGQHVINATAPGHKPFSETISLGVGDKRTATVPLLDAADVPAAAVASASMAASDESVTASGGMPPTRIAGLAIGGLGVVGIAIGSVFGLRAISLNKTSQADCTTDSFCNPQGKDARNDARSAGTVSTLAFVGGGVLVGAGVTLFALSGSRRSGPSVALEGVPPTSGLGPGVRLSGAF
jgi:hypothetical protein